MRVCVYVCMCVNVNVYVCECVCMCVCVYVCMCVVLICISFGTAFGITTIISEDRSFLLLWQSQPDNSPASKVAGRTAANGQKDVALS